MRSGNGWLENPRFYALLLATVAALFLIAVGTRADTLPFPANARLTSDAEVSHYPNALYFQRSIQHGQFPLWRPLLMSGQPFAANPLNKVWYPPQWLALALPVALHLNVLAWLHMVIAGLGMRAFGTQLGLSVGVANVMGLLFMFTPRLIGAIGAGHLDVQYAMAWLPWLMWTADLALRGESPWFRHAALVGLIGALSFLADTRISAFSFALAGGYVLANGRALNRRSIYGLTVGAVLTVGLTAVQWMPLLELAPYLSRGALNAEGAALFSIEPVGFLTVIVPLSNLAHETLLYTGLLVLISALIGTNRLWKRKQRATAVFWWGCILFAAWYAMGDKGALWPLLTSIAPPLVWLRVPPRIWIVGIFALIVLAGYGVHTLIAAPRLRRQQALAVAIIGVIMVGELLLTNRLLIAPRPQSVWLDKYEPLARALLNDGVTRVYSPDFSLPQQVSSYWNILDFGGVDPFQLQAYIPEFEAATGTKVTRYTVTLPAFEGDPSTAVIDAVALARWHVSHVVSAFSITSLDLQPVAQVQDVFIYRNNRFTTAQVPPLYGNCGLDSPVARQLPGFTMVSNQASGTTGCYLPPSLLPSFAITFSTAVGTALLLRRSRGKAV